MSACPLIFLQGNERIAFTDSVIMIHAPYTMFEYNTSEPEFIEEQKQLRRLREEFAQTLADVCPKDPSIKLFIFDHEDHYITAENLVKMCGKEKIFTQLIQSYSESLR